ncbi:MAG: ABC transporter ATP-binding protein [Oscillospiraceae bacterium]
MNAIELTGVTRAFPGFALQDITFALPEGCIMGLVGENGAGKSTTLRLIMNTLHRDAGEISVLGESNRSPGFSALKEDIGVVLDEAYFPEVLTATQVGKVMAHTYARWDAACYQSYLTRFALPEKKQFKDFSRGMKMKLAIAVALSHAPRLLLLDEATGGLDPMVRDEILTIFSDFTRDEGHTILMSSHIVSDLEKVCDYIAFLHGGRLLFCAEKDRLLEDYGILTCTAAQLAELSATAVCGVEQSPYGVRALVKRGELPAALPVERANLEEIIVLLAKGEGTR